MRYYLIDSESNEHKIDFTYQGRSDTGTKQFVFEGNYYFIKKIAHKMFISLDNISWQKLAVQNTIETTVLNSKVYKIYKGYKPSGISNSKEGDLVTQMPGKVVRVITSVGAEVKKGDTLLILEAMKMENEIKSTKDGVISSILVKEGQALEVGQLMIEIE